jgi:hypothetical protein
MLKRAISGAVLGGIGVLIFGAFWLSPGWLILLCALDPSIVIYPIVGAVAGALIGAGFELWVAVGALIGNSRHHLWKIWLRLDAMLIDWLQKRGKN